MNDCYLNFVWNGLVNMFENEHENSLNLLKLLLKTSSSVGIEKYFNDLFYEELKKLKNKEINLDIKKKSLKINSKGNRESKRHPNPDLFLICNNTIYPIEIKLAPRLVDLILGYESDSNELATQLAKELENCKEKIDQIQGLNKREKLSQGIIYDCFKYHDTDTFSFENNNFINKGIISIGIVSTFDEKQIENYNDEDNIRKIMFLSLNCLSENYSYSISIENVKSKIITYNMMLKKKSFGYILGNLYCILIAIMLEKSMRGD